MDFKDSTKDDQAVTDLSYHHMPGIKSADRASDAGTRATNPGGLSPGVTPYSNLGSGDVQNWPVAETTVHVF